MPRPPTPGPGPAMADPRWDYLNRFSLAYELHARLAPARSRSEVAEILLPELEAEMEAEVALMVLVDRATGRPTVFGGSDELRRDIGGGLRDLPAAELRRILDTGPEVPGQAHRTAVPIRIGISETGVLLIAGAKPFGDPDRIALEAIATFLGVLLRQLALHSELERAYRELRLIQADVSRRDRLEALGHLAAGIAGRLSGIIAPVPAYAGLLLTTARSLDDAERTALKRLRQAGGDATRILDEMRKVARRQVREDRAPELLDAEQLLNDVVVAARHLWTDEGDETLPVRVESAANLPPVLGHGDDLRDALTELLLNALAAVRNRPGSVVLRARPGAGTDEDLPGSGPPAVVLEVVDTGVGMDAATLARSTDPFFSTRADAGAGLGLAQVHATALRNGGRLTLRSTPGEGTTAALVLPAFRNGPRSLGEDRSRDRPLHVLVVDPDPGFGTLLSEILAFQGHRPRRSAYATEAVDTFLDALDRDDPFDVVIAAVGSPGDVPPELLGALNETDPDLAIILVGSWTRSASARPPGLVATLPKPLRPGQLEEALRRLESSRSRPGEPGSSER